MINRDTISITDAERVAHRSLASAASALGDGHPVARRHLDSAIRHLHLSAAAAICGDAFARAQHLVRSAHEARAAHRALAGFDADDQVRGARCVSMEGHRSAFLDRGKEAQSQFHEVATGE